jgi:hypothetical protein
MQAHWKSAVIAAIMFIAAAVSNLHAQQNFGANNNVSILHIQDSVTTLQTGFPQYLHTYHVLDGAMSPAEATSLTGTISLENHTTNFSEVLWLLAYWEGKCPVDDRSLTGANFIWSDILKNPAQSDSKFPVNLHFPHALPMTGCIGFVFGGGLLFAGAVTMPVTVNAGDCMVVIYGRTGNGATDNQTQVKALLEP